MKKKKYKIINNKKLAIAAVKSDQRNIHIVSKKLQIKYCFKKLLVCFISKRSSLVSSYSTKSYTKIIVESVHESVGIFL